jgi:hypothetical protein
MYPLLESMYGLIVSCPAFRAAIMTVLSTIDVFTDTIPGGEEGKTEIFCENNRSISSCRL